MKRKLFSILTVSLLACLVNAQDAKPETKPEQKSDFSKIFKNDSEKTGYAIGMNVAASLKNNLKRQEVNYDPAFIERAFHDGFAGTATLITEDQEKEILGDLNKELRAKAEEKRKQMAEENKIKGEKNKAEGEAFLAKHKTEPGVMVTESGLQYKVLTEGTGPIPTATDEVTVNYRGTLLDGTEFDNSAKRGKPLTTRVTGGIIKGWSEALQLMKTGSKWEVWIPAELAYGANPPTPAIAPNATLVFEIELLATKAGTPMPNAAMHPSAPLTSDIIKVPSAAEIKKGAKIETIKPEDVDKEKAKTNP
jgi:FKBP-type peptidyl-prolyl cis-trans isomerase